MNAHGRARADSATGLAAERLDRVRRILKLRGIVKVDELREELGVSAATVRRDLAELERRGRARRVHGGAVAVRGRLDEPVFDDKTAIAAAEKKRIARAAAKLIGPDDSVFLDGGSTVLAMAPMLIEMTGVTVVTNSLRVAGALASGGPRMILVGGEFRALSQTTVGSLTEALIDRVHVDRAFMGPIGLSVREGLTTTDPREAQTKALVMAHAHEVVLLADAGKLGKVSFVRFGSPGDVDVLVTDRRADRKMLQRFRKKGVKVKAV